MSDRLDGLVYQLALAPADRPLDGLEAEIGSSILRERREAKTARELAPVRLASVGLALAMGVTAGGAAATSAILKPHPLEVFSSSDHLAPSSLLEGQR